MSNKKRICQEQQTFDQLYQPQEQEILALTDSSIGGGAGKGGRDVLWTASRHCAAYIDAAGQCHRQTVRLEWLVESTAPEHYRFFLRPNCIYRLRVRPQRADRDFSLLCFMLLEILEENPDSPALQAELEHYLTPVVLNEPGIGQFSLNRDFASFEGHADWLGQEVHILLDADAGHEESANQSLALLRRLHSQAAEFDRRWRSFAAEQLLEDAVNWQGETDEPAVPPESLDAEAFARCIELSELALQENGFTAYYDDGDLFFGHVILVEGRQDGEPDDAYIAG